MDDTEPNEDIFDVFKLNSVPNLYDNVHTGKCSLLVKNMVSKEKEITIEKNKKNKCTSPKGKPYYKTFCFYLTLTIFIISLNSVVLLMGTDIFETNTLKLLVLKEGATIFDVWKKPETVQKIYIYPFNYTNIDRINFERPHVEEIGPYVFVEKVEKVNIVFNENGTLTFSENRTHFFDPDLSNGNIDDQLYTPNIPFLGATSQGNEKGMVSQLALAAFLKGLDTRVILPVSVGGLVDGFDDSFSLVARKLSTILKGVTPPKFGMLVARTGLGKDRMTIGTGNPDLNSLGVVSSFNGISKLNYWNTEECNSITGSDGSLFPGKVVQKQDKVYMFIPGFCRRIPLVYDGIQEVINDFETKRYELPHNIYSSKEENPYNECFCNDDNCPPSGVFVTSKCNFDAPVSVSFPHFLHGDENLRTNVTGLRPDSEKHRFYMSLHSSFGVPIGGKLRFQLNVQVKHCPFISGLEDIPDGTFLPVAWVDVSLGEVEGYGKDVLYHATYTLFYIKQAILVISIIILLLSFFKLCNLLTER